MAGRVQNAQLERRLASILALDTVGYSRLLGSSEQATHEALKDLFANLVAPTIRRCEGRIFKRTGDGLLAEFGSVVQATLSAVLIQQAMRGAGQPAPGRPHIQFRIGINLGEVIVEPDDLYGDDINVAARLEALAEPGGVCVSQVVAEQVGEKLPITFEDLGPQSLKNIARPVRAFRVEIPALPLSASLARHSRPARSPDADPRARAAIAVLPFVNLSGDPDQEYFADGLTEEIIARLAGWRGLPVIARNSTFKYKKRARDIRSVGRDLNARYVVEGSVRRSGSRVRIGLQVVEADSGERIFAERYDREFGDILALQDDIARSVVGEISPEVLRLERERIARSPPLNLDAYECYQRGLWHHYRYSKESAAEAVRFFREALRADPDYAPAMAALAITLVHSGMSGWAPPASYEEAASLAGRAIAIDPRDPQSHFALGLAHYHDGRIQGALADLQQAVRLNPSHAAAYANIGFILNYLDRPEEALQAVSTAFLVSPADTRQFLWHTALAGAHYLLGQYAEAVEAGQRGLALRADYLHTARYVAAALGQQGRGAEAAPYLAMVSSLDGTLGGTRETLSRVFVASALERILEGLRKAGFA